MPIEIRELIIKTEIVSLNTKSTIGIKDKEIIMLKSQLLQECKRLISEKNRENSYKR